MTNHKARNKLANQKWIHRSVYPCGISEQAFGSRFADGLHRGFYDTSGCNAGYCCCCCCCFYGGLGGGGDFYDLEESVRIVRRGTSHEEISLAYAGGVGGASPSIRA